MTLDFVLPCPGPEFAQGANDFPDTGNWKIRLVAPAAFDSCPAQVNCQIFANNEDLSTAQWCLRALQGSAASWIAIGLGDLRLHPGFFSAFEYAVQTQPKAEGFVCRAYPKDTRLHMDPVTLEIPQFSGTLLIVSRSLWERTGGWDGQLQGFALLADFSLRTAHAKGSIYYLPSAAYTCAAQIPDAMQAYVQQQAAALLLHSRYGSFGQALKAHFAYCKQLQSPQPHPGIRKALLRQYTSLLGPSTARIFGRHPLRAKQEEIQTLLQSPYDRGECTLPQPVLFGPLVSVVMRTHARADRLRNALASVAHQTYKNYEIIVVEDGLPTAKQVAMEEFPYLPITYHATMEHVGRGRAGNLGLSLAKGEYINFLDDDDYFYPDHLETLVSQAMQYPESDMILGCSAAMKTDADPTQLENRQNAQLELIRFDRITVFTMAQMCQIPLQSVLFKSKLYKQFGGLREDIDAHEDWAMWLKYLAHARRSHPKQPDVQRATSIFVQPLSRQNAQKRMQEYMAFDQAFFSDPSLQFTVTLQQMREFYMDMLADIEHVNNLGQLEDFLQQQQNREQER